MMSTSRKLRHYFQAHKIKVASSYLLGDTLHNKDANGRVVKWSVELGAFTIEFAPRSMIKSQASADFVVEWTEIQDPPPDTRSEHWIMYFNGALNRDGAGYSSRLPTMLPSTKPSFMVSGSLLHLASSIC